MGIFPLHQQLQGVLLGLLLFEDRHLGRIHRYRTRGDCYFSS